MRARRLIVLFCLPAIGALADDPAPTWRGKPAAEWAAALIKSSDPADRLKAAMALWQLAPKSAPTAFLIRARLRDRDEVVRQLVAETLGRMGPAAAPAIPDLVGALADADVHVRIAAAEALGKIPLDNEEELPQLADAVAPLAGLLEDSAPRVRVAAAQALGRILSRDYRGPNQLLFNCIRVPPKVAEAAAGRLAKALADPDPAVRAVALDAIRYFGRRAAGAEPALLALRDSQDEALADAARLALAWIIPDRYERRLKEVIYVVDRSGSLDPVFDFVKAELSKSINRMNSTQKFNIIWFSDNTVYRLASDVVRATEDNKTQVLKHLRDVEARGTTDPRRALEAALDARPDLIVVLSDGGFDPDFVEEMTKANHVPGREPVRINTVAFVFPGSDGHKNLELLAKKNHGRSSVVDLSFLGR